MHECNALGKFVQLGQALCLSSLVTPFNMQLTHRKCGTDEGQMRNLIGYLVAARGEQRAVARKFVDRSPRFRCDQFLCSDLLRGLGSCEQDPRAVDSSFGVLAGSDLSRGVPAREPRTIIQAGEDRTDDGSGRFAGAIPPNFGALA